MEGGKGKYVAKQIQHLYPTNVEVGFKAVMQGLVYMCILGLGSSIPPRFCDSAAMKKKLYFKQGVEFHPVFDFLVLPRLFSHYYRYLTDSNVLNCPNSSM